MKMIKNMLELIVKYEGEKMKFCVQMIVLFKEKMEVFLKEMDDRYVEEVRGLFEKMDIQIDGIEKLSDD